MSLVSYIVVFLITWLILFFISLPIAVNISEKHQEGFANSAPDKTYLKIKIISSFLISFFPSYLIYLIVENELLNYFFNNNFF